MAREPTDDRAPSEDRTRTPGQRRDWSDDNPACAQCLALDATCRRCTQQGALALRWLRAGLTVRSIARRLRLRRERVLRLVEQAQDREDLRRYRGQRPLSADARM